MNRNNDPTAIFSKNLRYLRGPLSLRELSEKINIQPNTLSQYEHNCRSPRLDIFMEICNYFSISAEDLLRCDLEVQPSPPPVVDEVLQGNRSLADPTILKKFENVELYCYYYSGTRDDCIREGKLQLLTQYGEREFVVGKLKTASQSYSCKLVVEGTDCYYIYGTNEKRYDRMVMSFQDHHFLSNTEKLKCGIGLVVSTSSRGRLMTQIVVMSSIKLIGNPSIPNGSAKLHQLLDMGSATSNSYILSKDKTADFTKWLIANTPSHSAK